MNGIGIYAHVLSIFNILVTDFLQKNLFLFWTEKALTITDVPEQI